MKIPLTLISVLIVQAQAANVLTIDIRNSFISRSNPIVDELGESLQSGDLIQLGYFDSDAPSTTGSIAFANFVPLRDPSGDLATNLGFSDSGTFRGEAKISDEVNAPDASSLTLQFGLRFFNGPTLDSSTFSNIVTNANWTFSFVDENQNPPPLPSRIDISGFNQASQNDVDSAVWEGLDFRTNIQAVPEPSTALAALLGLGLLLGKRRR